MKQRPDVAKGPLASVATEAARDEVTFTRSLTNGVPSTGVRRYLIGDRSVPGAEHNAARHLKARASGIVARDRRHALGEEILLEDD